MVHSRRGHWTGLVAPGVAVFIVHSAPRAQETRSQELLTTEHYLDAERVSAAVHDELVQEIFSTSRWKGHRYDAATLGSTSFRDFVLSRRSGVCEIACATLTAVDAEDAEVDLEFKNANVERTTSNVAPRT